MTEQALLAALEESVKLQSHYAELLNMHDGGKRRTFANAQEWIDRLAHSYSPDHQMMGDCRRCGLPQSEHHYNGAAYGVCGDYI